MGVVRSYVSAEALASFLQLPPGVKIKRIVPVPPIEATAFCLYLEGDRFPFVKPGDPCPLSDPVYRTRAWPFGSL